MCDGVVKLDLTWVGVRFAELAERAGMRDEARFILCHGYDGYTTNLPLVEALKDDVLLAHTVVELPLRTWWPGSSHHTSALGLEREQVASED